MEPKEVIVQDIPSLDEAISNPEGALLAIEGRLTASQNGHKKGKAKVKYLADGSRIIECDGKARLFGPPPDLKIPGQWGNKGGGGGGQGGQAKPKRGSGSPPPAPPERSFQPPQMAKAFGFGQLKFEGKDIIGGGTGHFMRNARLDRMRFQIKVQRAAAKLLKDQADDLELASQEKEAEEFRRRANATEFQTSRLETKIQIAYGVSKKQPSTEEGKKKSKRNKNKDDKKGRGPNKKAADNAGNGEDAGGKKKYTGKRRHRS